MGWRLALHLGILTALPGCHIASYATHNLVSEPAQELNRLKLRQRMNTEARAAWKDEYSRHPAGTYSGAYADGFIDGYVDHLDNGGTPNQPAAPPIRYRRHASDFTPVGLQAQKDYLIAFRHGAEVAAASGGRHAVVVAVDLPAPQQEPPLNITYVAAPQSGAAPAPKPPLMPPPVAPGSPISGVGVPAVPAPKLSAHPAPVRQASLGAPQALGASPAPSAPGAPPQGFPVIQAGDRGAPVRGRVP